MIIDLSITVGIPVLQMALRECPFIFPLNESDLKRFLLP